MTHNPIRVLRNRLGITRAQLAKELRCSYHDLTTAELGYEKKMRQQIAKSMAAMSGSSPDEVNRQYEAWRAEQATRQTSAAADEEA